MKINELQKELYRNKRSMPPITIKKNDVMITEEQNNRDEVFVSLFKRSIKIFNRNPSRMIGVISAINEEEFKNIKHEFMSSMMEVNESIDIERIDWVQLTQDNLIEELSRYMKTINEQSFMDALREKSKKGFVKAGMIIYAAGKMFRGVKDA